MRAIVQRVSAARVEVDGNTVGQIERGLLALVAAVDGDTDKDRAWMADKLVALRIFPDGEGKMNRSAQDIAAPILLVSNFTVAGDTRKGTRPSYAKAMHPDQAEPMLDALADDIRSKGTPVETGRFGAMMKVCIENDGPVTVTLESPTTA
jgi:D-tyrosyl-tRNA(Tyr) deacylase